MSISNFLRNCCIDFQSVCKSLHTRQQWRGVLFAPNLLPHDLSLVFFIFAILIEVSLSYSVSVLCISLKIKDVEDFFKCFPLAWRSFHLLLVFQISFMKYLKILSLQVFVCLVRLTPKYFILFVLNVKGIISLVSFSACSAFVYRKTTDILANILFSLLTKGVYSCRSFLS